MLRDGDTRCAGTHGGVDPEASPAADPDDALIARVAAGDASAWPLIVERHLSSITGFAWHMLRDAAEAEDVAQETFVRLMRKVQTWRPGGARLTTWLHRVAINLCIDRRRAKRPDLLDDVQLPPESLSGEAGHEHRLATTRAVRAALAALPARQRTALVLVHYQGFTNREAAALLEVSVDALESLLARGRRAVRRDIAPVATDLLGSET